MCSGDTHPDWHGFPATITDPLNRTETWVVDARWGKLTSRTDPNGAQTSYTWDAFGRLQTTFDYDTLNRPVRTWWPLVWASPSPSSPSVYDLMELRGAVTVDRVAIGLAAFAWTDPSIIAGTGVKVRAVHLTELRTAIQDLWTAAGLGTVPAFTGGAVVASTRRIKLSDLTDLRGRLVQYENSAYGQANAARVVQGYDAYDGSSQFGRGKRTQLWDGTGSTSWTYDLLGRVTQEARVIDRISYLSQQGYDALNRLTTQTQPDGEVVTTLYGPDGRVNAMNSSLSVTLLNSVAYNALVQPSSYQLGSSSVGQAFWGVDAGRRTNGLTAFPRSTSAPP